jgi:asparagine synthase (glutamine-hydrolysing)
MVSGQGPDELFAGYARYVKVYEEHGEEELENHLWNDVSVTYEVNINRDTRAVGAHGLYTCFPYLYPSFVHAAMSIPGSYKVDLTRKPERKVVFRDLAITMGLPKEVAFAPKKATQYSSGSAKTIREAVAKFAEEAKGLSTSKVRTMIQTVLNRVGREAGGFEPIS